MTFSDSFGSGRKASELSNILERIEELIVSQRNDKSTVRDALIGVGTQDVSVAVLDRGDIRGNALGSSDADRSTGDMAKRTLDDGTIFQACSISKPITAFAVIKLCQEGKLNLDSPISDYLDGERLSWISTSKTFTLASSITLRQLLSHTSGLSGHGFGGYRRGPLPTIHEILTGTPPANNEPIKLTTVPGQTYSYSGGGYTVIQLILETVLGKPFHQLMDEIILKPLKMSRSTYMILPEAETNYAPAYLTGELRADPDHHSQPESAAVGLWTTPSDLLRAIQAVQQSLKSGGFLEQRWVKIMLTEVQEGMGLGWAVERNGTTFHHSGDNDPGYECIVIGYADLSKMQKSPDIEADFTSAGDYIADECGICIMTSSALGYANVCVKLTQSIPYLIEWPSMNSRPWVPFLDRSTTISESALGWIGEWGSSGWIFQGDIEKGLFIKHGATVAIPVLPAAIPPKFYAEGPSIDLVTDGLDLLLRLGMKAGGVRIIDVWQNYECKTLEIRHS